MKLKFEFDFKKTKYIKTNESDYCADCGDELKNGEIVYESFEFSPVDSFYDGCFVCKECGDKRL